MSEKTTGDLRGEWRIDVDGGAGNGPRCSGSNTPQMVELLLELFLRDRGSVADWDDATVFGNVILRFSRLRREVVACWLNLTEFDLSPKPDTAPVVPPSHEKTWEMTSPNGRSMTVVWEPED